jgi:hypothetical protein
MGGMVEGGRLMVEQGRSPLLVGRDFVPYYVADDYVVRSATIYPTFKGQKQEVERDNACTRHRRGTPTLTDNIRS